MAESFELDEDAARRTERAVLFTERFQKNPRLYSGKFSFRLITDANSGKALAKILTMDGTTLIENNATLKYKWGCLDGAKAGYEGDCTPYDNYYYFDQGPCVIQCLSGGSITPGTPPTGVVGTPFSHTVTSSGLSTGPTMTGLPPAFLIQVVVYRAHLRPLVIIWWLLLARHRKPDHHL